MPEISRRRPTVTRKGRPNPRTGGGLAIPVKALDQAGLLAGDQVLVEALDDGELRVRRGVPTFDQAFGSVTDTYPAGYLEQLDAEDATR